jgi:xanthine dehydrogenase YagS FAD-binding subunit
MKAFAYITAESLDAATRHLAHAGGRPLIKAGGIDVLDRLKERIDEPDAVLSLRRAGPVGKAIEHRAQDGVIAIHALTTVAEVGADPIIRERLPALAEAARGAATPQIRNVATVGGNLCQKPRCWYYRSRDYHCLKKGGATCYAVQGDNRYHAIFGAGACHIVHPSNLAVPLLACGASVRLVRLADGEQTRRDVTLDDFFRVPANPQHDENILAPGELVEEVLVPVESAGSHAVYEEVRHKQSFDWPLVSCAVNLNSRALPRVVLGAVAPIPWRLKEVERLIAGRKLTDDRIAEARTTATRAAEPMPHNRYKVPLVAAIVEIALRAADQGRIEGDE